MTDSLDQSSLRPRWSVWMALLTVGVLPATTARRTCHVTLRQAYLLHWIAGLLTTVLVIMLVAWAETHPPFGFAEWCQELDRTPSWIVHDYATDPLEMAGGTVLVVLGIEVGYLALAALAMPWGARDEPMGQSFRFALQRTWLNTPQALPIVFVVMMLIATIAHAYTNWRPNYPAAPQMPKSLQAPKPADPDSPEAREYETAKEAYQAAQNAHWEAWTAILARRPWLLRHDGEIVFTLGFLVTVWWLWALLRGVGAYRPTMRTDRSPLCENCGYNLTTMTLEEVCPECGEPVLASLGPDVRPEPLWVRRGGVGLFRAWWNTGVQAVFRPRLFGRQVRLNPTAPAHRVFVVTQCVLVWIVGTAGIGLVGYAMFERHNRGIWREPDFWLACAGAGSIVAVVALFLTFLAALVVSLDFHVRDKRNVLGAAIQVVSYQSGFLVVWAAFMALTGALVWFAEPMFNDLRNLLRIDDELLMFLAWFLANFPCLVVYVILAYKGTAGARYANK